MRVTSFLLVSLIALVGSGCATESSSSGGSNLSKTPSFLTQEIKDRMAALPYQSEEQLYENLIRLAYIGQPAIPYLVDGLKNENARTRSSSAYVLGLLRDRTTIEPLEKALDDRVPEVKYEVATSLAIMGDQKGYPVLIEGLSDADIRNRYKSAEALKMLTGLDFGYHHDAAPADRARSIKKWDAWWKKMKKEEQG